MSSHANEMMIIENQDGVHVVRLLTEALLDPMDIDRVEGELQKLISEDPEPRIVIALDTVDHLSSLMIGVLIKLRASVAGKKGEICLAAVPERLQNLFDVVKMSDVFETYGTTQAAVLALKSPD